jgi:aryl-alcohol dehydrogenase (NADP+)
VESEVAPLAQQQGIALTPYSPLKGGFLSGKYRRDGEVADSARAAYVGGPTDGEFEVIDTVATIADQLETTSAAVALAWLLARAQTVVPIIGARRLAHLEGNLAGLDVYLTQEHLRILDEVSAPTLSYPAEYNGQIRAMLQFAGTTVDGEASTVYPPLLASDIRY